MVNAPSKPERYFSVYILSEALGRRIEEHSGQCVTVTATYWLMKDRVCVVTVSGCRFDRVTFSWKMWWGTITNNWLLPPPFLQASCAVSLNSQPITSLSPSLCLCHISLGSLFQGLSLFLFGAEKYTVFFRCCNRTAQFPRGLWEVDQHFYRAGSNPRALTSEDSEWVITKALEVLSWTRLQGKLYLVGLQTIFTI